MSGGRTWTIQEERYLALLVAHNRKPAERLRLFNDRFPPGRGESALVRATSVREHVMAEVARLRAIPESDWPAIHEPLESVDGPTIIPEYIGEHRDAAALWKRAEKNNEEVIEYQKHRHRAAVDFADQNLPVGLIFASDQHITKGATNLKRMRKDAELIRDAEGAYAILGGDGVDNHVKHRSAMVQGGSKPSEEWDMYDHYLGTFQNKILAMISGNHDDFSKDITDFDVVGNLAKKHRLFYAPDYVVLDISVGKQTYGTLVRHQYRYESTFNKGHAIKRLWEMGQHDFDIGCLCHKHEVHCEPFFKHGKRRMAIRPGSYQFTSGYGRRYGYGTSDPYCPTVIVLPHVKHMIGFDSMYDGLGFLEYLRAGWPESGRVWEEAA